MPKQTLFSVTINGSEITDRIRPILIDLTVSLAESGQADTTQIVLDDTSALVEMPVEGANVSISLGWVGGQVREVFRGVVDEVRSQGSRSAGRMLMVSAKGFDGTGKAKASQSKHYDKQTVQSILSDAGRRAGVPSVRVDPELAGEVIEYFATMGESFLHLGRRLARQIGGNFRIQGQEAVMARVGASYAPSVTAAEGVNLHGWDITPISSRGRFGSVKAQYYDADAAKWDEVEEHTGLDSDVSRMLRPAATSREDAKRQAKAQARGSARDSGLGSVTIEGDPGAIPDGNITISGTRPGVDGAYRIKCVNHTLSRSGFITHIELVDPKAGVGKDPRRKRSKSSGGGGKGLTAGNIALDKIIAGQTNP